MTVEPVASGGVTPVRLVGVSARLADARAHLRAAAPSGSWDAVLAEVERLHVEQSLPLLEALKAVYAKLAAGWVPRS